MSEPRLVLCSGATIPEDDVRRIGRRLVELDALGHPANLNLRLEDVARVFLKHLTPRLVDLLEIAAYVYTADATTKRAGKWDDDASEPWERDFRMVVPVRDPEFWTRAQVGDVLGQALGFLSDDRYEFDFVPLTTDRPQQEYLQIRMESWPFTGVPRICLFSGGLDSLAGAVEMAARGEPLVLVSHRPVTTIARRQTDLVKQLEKKFSKVPLLHIPVCVNKAERFGREYTQRTRSFLFSALGCAVAQSVDAEGMRFFENGVVSLNFPVADEVLRARASRTTHPQALYRLAQLYSLVAERPADRPFVIDNPFLHQTKREVVERIANHGAADLIEWSCSCAHTRHKGRSQWHCGTCSQCIDRRIAVFAAGLQDRDPERDYVVNVFTGPRKPGYEQSMAVDYARHALELYNMDAETMAVEFNAEIGRAIRFEGDRRAAAQAIVDMHGRHAADVWSVLTAQLQHHVPELTTGSLAPSSMLALIAGQRHLSSVWGRYVTRIGDILASGVPIACHSNKPKNEPALQELCDGLLTGHDLDLQREYPFLRWASVRTKPDWSAESLDLWVELKYVRTRGDRVNVTEAIAADVTKYGDNNRRTLFVIYDPGRHLGDDAEVAADITRHPAMFARIIH
jgi:7-cyano-7-deazaguanine synthase in queuosine biosynthesis